MKSSLVVNPTNLGILYVQISPAIIETHILLNIVKGKHDSVPVCLCFQGQWLG